MIAAGPAAIERLLGAEQPAGADDRAHRRPDQADQADVAFEGEVALPPGGGRLRSTDVCSTLRAAGPPDRPDTGARASYPRWGQPETSTVLGDRTRKGGSNAWLSGPMDSA